MRTLLTYAAPHRAVLGISLLLALLGSAAGLAQPLAAKAVIDALAANGSLLAPLVVLCVLVVAGAAVNGIYTWLLGVTGERVVLTVRRSLAARLVLLRDDDLYRELAATQLVQA